MIKAKINFYWNVASKNCSLTLGDTIAVVDANFLREPPLETVYHLDGEERSNRKKDPVVKRGL